MEDEDYFEQLFERSFSRMLWVGIAALVGVVLCVLLSSCKTQYVPVPEYHYDYSHSTDTVRERDSVLTERETIIRETNSGDSALLASLGIQLKEGQKAILVLQKELERIRNEKQKKTTDTIIKVDSVRVPYPVEGKVKRWEKVKLMCVGCVGGVGAIGVAAAVIWIRRRYRRKE